MNQRETRSGKALLKIYRLFDGWAKDFPFACEKGCATCCTQSVTMTTLEGELVYAYLREHPELLPLLGQLPEDSPTPAATTNRFARACLQGEDAAEEDPAWNFAHCIFLKKDCCVIYPVRPFMCRSFGSRVKCSESGCAEVAPLFLTLNTIIMQCIEHLDRGRPWGNMNTVLRLLTEPVSNGTSATQLPRAEPLPGFLIPPEEEERLRTRMDALLAIINNR